MASLGIPLVRLYSVFDNSGETGGIKWAISFREEGRGRLITGDCPEGYHEFSTLQNAPKTSPWRKHPSTGCF